jgi:hypothetical protein
MVSYAKYFLVEEVLVKVILCPPAICFGCRYVAEYCQFSNAKRNPLLATPCEMCL